MSAVTTAKIISANPTRNNGATLLYGNTSASVTQVLGKNGVARKPLIQTTPKVTTKTQKALSSGTFGYIGQGEYFFLNYINSKLNGTAQSSPYLRGTRIKPVCLNARTTRSLTYLALPVYFLAFANGNYNVTFTPATSSQDYGRDDANTNAYTDVGGEFVFNPTGKLPSQNSGNHKYYSYNKVK